MGFVGRGAVLRIGGRNEEGRRSALCIRGWWGATIIVAGRTTIMMAGGEESKAEGCSGRRQCRCGPDQGRWAGRLPRWRVLHLTHGGGGAGRPSGGRMVGFVRSGGRLRHPSFGREGGHVRPSNGRRVGVSFGSEAGSVADSWRLAARRLRWDGGGPVGARDRTAGAAHSRAGGTNGGFSRGSKSA